VLRPPLGFHLQLLLALQLEATQLTELVSTLNSQSLLPSLLRQTPSVRRRRYGGLHEHVGRRRPRLLLPEHVGRRDGVVLRHRGVVRRSAGGRDAVALRLGLLLVRVRVLLLLLLLLMLLLLLRCWCGGYWCC